MFLSDKRVECNNCGEQMPPQTRTTFDEDGLPVHAEGCVADFWGEQMAVTGGHLRPEGRYRGPQLRKPSVCPRCHLTNPCDCGE